MKILIAIFIICILSGCDPIAATQYIIKPSDTAAPSNNIKKLNINSIQKIVSELEEKYKYEYGVQVSVKQQSKNDTVNIVFFEPMHFTLSEKANLIAAEMLERIKQEFGDNVIVNRQRFP